MPDGHSHPITAGVTRSTGTPLDSACNVHSADYVPAPGLVLRWRRTVAGARPDDGAVRGPQMKNNQP